MFFFSTGHRNMFINSLYASDLPTILSNLHGQKNHQDRWPFLETRDHLSYTWNQNKRQIISSVVGGVLHNNITAQLMIISWTRKKPDSSERTRVIVRRPRCDVGIITEHTAITSNYDYLINSSLQGFVELPGTPAGRWFRPISCCSTRYDTCGSVVLIL